MDFQKNVSLAPLTTLKVGGRAEYFVKVRTTKGLEEACCKAADLSIPITVLGGGSNVVVAENGVKGLVIKNELKGIEYQPDNGEVLVTAGAGENWDELVKETVDKELWGLENLSAIPGTVGASPIQNIGAYGVEVGELIKSVEVYNYATDEWQTLSRDQCNFSYRDSLFKKETGKNLIVTSVTFCLSKNPKPKLHYKDIENYFTHKSIEPTLKEIRNAVVKVRKNKFPDLREVGTAGSFFKNPIISAEQGEALLRQYPDLPTYPESAGKLKISLGYLLDKVCNLRGHREGDVGLHDKQALVLVNYGKASSEDIENFANKITDEVYKKTNVKINWEPRKIF